MTDRRDPVHCNRLAPGDTPRAPMTTIIGLLLALSVMSARTAAAQAADNANAIALDPEIRARCLDVLRHGLRAEEFWPSIHAAEALTLAGAGDEVVAFLEPRLPAERDDQRRCGIARELVRAGRREFVDVLLGILAGSDPYGHVHAAESLYKVGELGDSRALRRAFAQSEPQSGERPAGEPINLRLRLMAAAALGRAGDPDAMAALRRALHHSDPAVYHLAAWVLGRIGDARDIAALRKNVARAPDALTRAYQEHALAALDDSAGLEALAANLNSPNPAVRTYAATFAGDARATTVAPQLIGLLDDETLDVRIRAAQSLLVLAQPAAPDDLAVLQHAGVAKPETHLYEWLARPAQQLLDQRRAAYEQLETAEDCREWADARRMFFRRQLGGFPEKTPLNAEVTGTLEREDYRVEKILYESRPHHHVTAVLYLPRSAPPYPAVLIACGHTKTGKAADYNQRLGILLAKHGMAALCYDPIGQGERSQILTDDGMAKHRSSTTEHFLTGVGAILTGTNTAQYRIWDGIRGIDYLCSRDDIRADRIGCTGCSGGGTLTSYIMALDERVVSAAPACYLTTFSKLIATIGPQDAEQNIFGQLAGQLDHPDYVLMRAPRPTLICSTTEDFFDIEGAWDTFRQSKRVYTRLGFPEAVSMIEADGGHGIRPETRATIIHWMQRWLLDQDAPVSDEEFPVWSVDELQCTSKGEVLLLENERSVFELNAARMEQLQEQRGRLAELPAAAARQTVRGVAGIRPLADIPAVQVRAIGSVSGEGYTVRKLVLEFEDGLQIPALKYLPAGSPRATWLWLAGAGSAAAADMLAERAQAGDAVLAIDLPSLGELRGSSANNLLGDWKNFFLAYLQGRSLVGLRCETTLAAARWLADGTSSATVKLMATGEAAVSGLHAAALEPDLFASVTLRDALKCWADVVRSGEPENQLTNAVHNVLASYDLPQLVELAGQDKVQSEAGEQ